MSIDNCHGTDCCGMEELSGFNGVSSNWMEDIWSVVDGNCGNGANLPAIFVFTGAEFQKEGSTPFAFAKWLRKNGERVVSTGKVKNNNSGNRIQAFLWTPSARFRKKYAAFDKKQQEKEIENDRESSSHSYW